VIRQASEHAWRERPRIASWQLAVGALRGNFTLPSIGTFRVKAMMGATEAPMVIMDWSLTRREKLANSKVICKVATALNN
jgi:hypothetical protein